VEEWARLAVQDVDYFKESLTSAATTLRAEIHLFL